MDGFEWIAPNDADRNILAYMRKDSAGSEYLVVINFAGAKADGYRLGVPKGKYKIVFNTDSPKFGGAGEMTKRIFNTERKHSHGKEYSIKIELPKLTCVYLQKIL